jgi:hypothetical protein
MFAPRRSNKIPVLHIIKFCSRKIMADCLGKNTVSERNASVRTSNNINVNQCRQSASRWDTLPTTKDKSLVRNHAARSKQPGRSQHFNYSHNRNYRRNQFASTNDHLLLQYRTLQDDCRASCKCEARPTIRTEIEKNIRILLQFILVHHVTLPGEETATVVHDLLLSFLLSLCEVQQAAATTTTASWFNFW